MKKKKHTLEIMQDIEDVSWRRVFFIFALSTLLTAGIWLLPNHLISNYLERRRVAPSAIPLASSICQIEEITVRGASLMPLVQDGQKLSLLSPLCLLPERDDLAAFRTAAEPGGLVIKRISAIPGDLLAIAKDGAVLVNDTPALAPNGSPYIATMQGRRMIELYAGVIPLGAYLVLGNPGSLDSARIGLIPYGAITGVVRTNRPRSIFHLW